MTVFERALREEVWYNSSIALSENGGARNTAAPDHFSRERTAMATSDITDSPVEIQVHPNLITYVDVVDADLGEFKWTVRDPARPYVHRHIQHNNHRSTARLHRVILSRMLGRELVSHEFCDHIDGNPLNNRRTNLRLATAAQNNCNYPRPKTNRSGYKGVSFNNHRRKWQASISVDNKNVNLGCFATPEEAHEAYCEAAKKYHGEFARFK